MLRLRCFRVQVAYRQALGSLVSAESGTAPPKSSPLRAPSVGVESVAPTAVSCLWSCSGKGLEPPSAPYTQRFLEKPPSEDLVQFQPSICPLA